MIVPANFIGQHYITYSSGVPSPAPTYLPKIWRSYEAGVDWEAIETSDNVFNWTTLDQMMAHFLAQGQDIYYQVYGTPNLSTHRVAGQTWTTVPDQGGNVGAGCVPDPVKLARFITLLVTRYPQIKYISPWNEPKWGNPVVKFPGSVTAGAVNVGDSVTGITSRAVGTVVSNTGSVLTVKLLGPCYSVNPFGNAEQIRVNDSASNVFTATSQNAVHYWFGTKAQLVSTAQTIYNAAKAVRPSITVMTPDFTEGANLFEEEWLQTWIDAGGLGYFDALAYHFYNYDIRPSDSLGLAFSLSARLAVLDSVLASRGLSGIPKIASECGNTSGWSFYSMSADRLSQAQTLKRVSAYLASRGWAGVIWFSHTQEYDGNPSANTVIADALLSVGRIVSGKTISGAYVAQDNSLRMLVDGFPVIF